MIIEDFDLVTVSHLFKPVVVEGIEISPTFSYFLREKYNIYTKAIYQNKCEKIIYLWERNTKTPFHRDEHLLAFVAYCKRYG